MNERGASEGVSGAGSKRPADLSLALPIAKRAKRLEQSAWDEALNDHRAASEIGSLDLKWRTLLKPLQLSPEGHAHPPAWASGHLHNSSTSSPSSTRNAHAATCADCAALASHRVSPAVFVPSQGRAFASLGEAVQKARTGDVIRLMPGCYVQQTPIVLERDGVTIVAAEAEGGGAASRPVKVVSHTQGQDCLVCHANGCEIRGITFVHSSCEHQTENVKEEDAPTKATVEAAGCINVDRGNLRVVNCMVTSLTGFGIKVQGTGSPWISSCTLSQCREVAVLLMGSSRAKIEWCQLSHNKCAGMVLLDSAAGELVGNTIAHNEKCGIVCAGRSSARVVGNAVLGGNGGGVWIRERSCVELHRNLIALSLKVSLQVSDDSNPTVLHNSICNGCNGGIVVHGRARGVFRHNVISGHNKAGLGVTDAAQPYLESNVFCRNRAGGAIFTGQSVTELHDNTFQDNLLFGIHVRANASVHAEGDSVCLNSGPGLQLQECGQAMMIDVALQGNTRSGAIAVGQATLQLSNCHVRSEAYEPRCPDVERALAHAGADNVSAANARQRDAADSTEASRATSKQQRIGVQVAAEARVEITGCNIQGHASGNVVVQGRSSCTLRDSSLSSGSWAGVVLQGTSTTVMNRVLVREARSAGVLSMDEAALTADSCQIVDGKGVGMLLAGSTRALLMRNSIIGNAGTGLMIKQSARVDLRRNRISGNGVHGLNLEGPCSVSASENAIFENEGAGIHALAVKWTPCAAEEVVEGDAIGPELYALANILVSGNTRASVAAAFDGPLRGQLFGNMLDSFHFSHIHQADTPQADDLLAHEGGGSHRRRDHGSGRAQDGASTSQRVEREGSSAEAQTDQDAALAPAASRMGCGGGGGGGCRLEIGDTLLEDSLQDNVCMEKRELVSLLKEELLPMDYLGPGRKGELSSARMPDGSFALMAALPR